MAHPSRDRLAGLSWAAVAILIWSGSLVMLRLGVTTTLNAYDLTMLRFGVAAMILAPIAWRHHGGSNRVSRTEMAAMITLFGAPYVLLVSLALTTASSAAAGALNPGVMAIATVSLGWMIFGDRIGAARLGGIAVTALGIVLFACAGGAVTTGHLILVGTGVMWAGYGLVVRAGRIPALIATAIVAVGSAVLYTPVYLVALPKQIRSAPAGDILLQAAFQGVLVSAVAIYAFNRSAELLGPVAGATLPALIPVVTLGIAVVLLGETAGAASLVSTVLVAAGLALILAGPSLIGRRSHGPDEFGAKART